MDIRAHLDSYRESLKKDALEDCVPYSKSVPTARPDKYPTVYDYMKFTLDAAKYHAESDDPTSYKLWLPKHQEAMVLLFERMVDEILWGANDATLEVVLKFVEEKGWKWFKFSKKAIVYTLRLSDDTPLELTIIPRSCGKWLDRLSSPGKTVLDADELTTIINLKSTPLARAVSAEKQANPRQKFIGMSAMDKQADPVPMYRPIDQVNGERVLDWSLPLFGGIV